MKTKTAIFLCNMGGPDSPASIRPYLENIFADPDIIRIPLRGRLRRSFARFLAKRREPKSRTLYQNIGGSSPLLRITEQQAGALQQRLEDNGMDCDVFPAMRYWHPFIEDAWKQVRGLGYKHIIAVSMYPFYASSTTGSLQTVLQGLQRTHPVASLTFIDRYGEHPLYIQALAEQLRTTIENDNETHVLLSAHSIPQKSIQKGDPYADEIERCKAKLQAALPETIKLHLSFQSKLGPVKWLGPDTGDEISRLSELTDELTVMPLGFVADNLETLYDMDQLYKDTAEQHGIKYYHRIPALNDHPTFIAALADLILQRRTT